jgi:hypothetical protein
MIDEWEIHVVIFWDIAPCRSHVNRRFGERSARPPVARWFLVRLIKDLEDGGGAPCILMVEALCYKLEGHRFETR